MQSGIIERLEADLGERVEDTGYAGGMVRTVSGRRLFLKTGSLSKTYSCEANGLKELSMAGEISVAKVVSVGRDYIATEYVEHKSPANGFFEAFGRDFARIHRHTASSFGFFEDNFIGANPQYNVAEGAEKRDWVNFYFSRRLLPQYRMAERSGYVTSRTKTAFATLESRLPTILSGSEEPPALLHGDLWAGNFICNTVNEAVLVDPAVYYGHREADLAMTKLFGGFSHGFYESYQREYPLKDGWEYREPLYRLYHVMNHLNLFGRSYLGETENILELYSG